MATAQSTKRYLLTLNRIIRTAKSADQSENLGGNNLQELWCNLTKCAAFSWNAAEPEQY